jgi:enoyl-CoA hydratase
MTDRVNYELKDNVATIAMDDGKVNALSLHMFADLNTAFDKAEAEGAIVIFTGNERLFSAGFDLAGLAAEPVKMLDAGFGLAIRILSFPKPVIVAATGHAIAMGAFLVLSGDYRIGTRGNFKIVANEVALGVQVPLCAIEVARQRLTPAHFHRAMNLSEIFTPDDAVTAGFFDEVLDAGDVAAAARVKAEEFSKLNMDAHKATKLAVRDSAIAAIRAGLEQDKKSFAGILTQAGS